MAWAKTVQTSPTRASTSSIKYCRGWRKRWLGQKQCEESGGGPYPSLILALINLIQIIANKKGILEKWSKVYFNITDKSTVFSPLESGRGWGQYSWQYNPRVGTITAIEGRKECNRRSSGSFIVTVGTSGQQARLTPSCLLHQKITSSLIIRWDQKCLLPASSTRTSQLAESLPDNIVRSDG